MTESKGACGSWSARPFLAVMSSDVLYHPAQHSGGSASTSAAAKSVSEADFSIDSDAEKEQLKEKSESLKDLLAEIKNDLGDKVKEVRLTSNLKTYPVCLISGGDISIEMEKVFNSMPNSDGKVKADKILEISAEHKILNTLKTLFETDKEKLKKYALVLYEQARLLEGLALDDAGEFVSALSDII